MDIKLNPFTDNLVFFDTEFSSNDPNTGEILSIGMVKMNGEELYLELEFNGETSDWVKTNILPNLNNKKVSRAEAVDIITKFIGNKKPYLISNVVHFDTVYLYKIFKFGETPFEQFSIDFYSLLFSTGIDPHSFTSNESKQKFCNKLGVDIDRFKLHNALDDAKLLREVYLKIIK